MIENTQSSWPIPLNEKNVNKICNDIIFSQLIRLKQKCKILYLSRFSSYRLWQGLICVENYSTKYLYFYIMTSS